jgi:hypothetical protein
MFRLAVPLQQLCDEIAGFDVGSAVTDLEAVELSKYPR